jgi:hypothetical protein
MEYLGAWGTLIHEKNLKSKISCQTPFNHLSVIKSPLRLWAQKKSEISIHCVVIVLLTVFLGVAGYVDPLLSCHTTVIPSCSKTTAPFF